MKSRAFSTLATGRRRAALAMAGLLGLAVGAPLSLRAQPAAAGANPVPGQPVSAYLDYREVNYSFVNANLPMSVRASAFKREPSFSGGNVTRGTLQLGGGASNELAFAWDRSAGKLYLDLNRNLDLADDPGGVFVRQRGAPDYYQTFTNIHLPFETAAGSRPMLADLSFYGYGQLSGSVAMRSFWRGKVILQGEEWQVGLLRNPSERRSSLESGSLLLRPWTERNKPFSLYSGSLEAVPFSRKLFVGNHAYELRCSNEAQGDTAKVRVQFAEQTPSLGELKITGGYVQRVTLEGGPYLVVLDKPEAVVKVPVGSYGQAKVCLKKGNTEAHMEGGMQFAEERITVNDKKAAVLTAGGPLTNSVSISRRGRNLLLNYQLVGAGGEYQLVNQDRLHPPEFTVYQGDKKVASGRFEFG